MKKLLWSLFLAALMVQVTNSAFADAEVLARYQKAAELGNPIAQYNLGWKYEHGQDVPQDYLKAAEWYKKAAAQGEKNAQSALDNMYKNGWALKAIETLGDSSDTFLVETEKPKVTDTKVIALLNKAQAALNANRYGIAKARLNEALVISPNNAEGLQMIRQVEENEVKAFDSVIVQ